MKIKPLNDSVLICRQAKESETKGGIIIPDSRQVKNVFGEVLAVGPGRFKENSTDRIPMGIEVGDVVLMRGTVSVRGEIQLDEPGEFVMISEEEIEAVVIEP